MSSSYSSHIIMNKKGFLFILPLVVIVLVLVSAVFIYGITYALTEGQETITIKDKWVKYDGDDAKYLISSEDGQVFQITDSLFKWRWDSSNLYAEINEGESCQIETQGWRFGFMSDYKNIITARCNN